MIQVHPVFAMVVSLIPTIILAIIGVPKKICVLVGVACVFLMFHIVGKLESGDYQAHRRGFPKNDKSKAKLCYDLCKHYTSTNFSDRQLADEINKMAFEILSSEKDVLEYNYPSNTDLDKYSVLLLMRVAEKILVSGRHHEGDGVLSWRGRRIFHFWEFDCLRPAVSKGYLSVDIDAETERLKEIIKSKSWRDWWENEST